jgi:hypothetical protein
VIQTGKNPSQGPFICSNLREAPANFALLPCAFMREPQKPLLMLI